jgi:dienelactone hydrolase
MPPLSPSRHHRDVARSAARPVAEPNASAPRAFAVGLRVVRLRDPRRTVPAPGGGREARTLLTYVRYPAVGPPHDTDITDAAPARARGPFPLIVFGHGFAVTPSIYARLLQSWTRAGYVVAAPVFPLGNGNAPGGPDESDLPNQPDDMSLVISRMLAASASPRSVFAGLIDPASVAVAGQSDGGDTALASAFDPRVRDRRVRAAVILSGAEIPADGPFSFPARGPALLATQGTADSVNLPAETDVFFAAAHTPKYLLRLLGAQHLPPYTSEQPQLSIVETVSTAFLDAYLEHRGAAPATLSKLGDRPGISSLESVP